MRGRDLDEERTRNQDGRFRRREEREIESSSSSTDCIGSRSYFDHDIVRRGQHPTDHVGSSGTSSLVCTISTTTTSSKTRFIILLPLSNTIQG